MISESSKLGEIYNVGPAQPTSIKEVVERTALALGVAFENLCEISDDRLGQDSRYWLDSSKIKNDLGWSPEITWEVGLNEMVEWGKKYLPEIRNLSSDYVLRG